MSLQNLLQSFQFTAQSEREKGTYFEDLIQSYLTTEPMYRELYHAVQTYSDWAMSRDYSAKDTGIDLVATTKDGAYHAIQCKFYAADYKIQKSDIDSFFTASGKSIFSHRLIVCTTNLWSDNAEEALIGQAIPVSKIDLHALENSVIDWNQYKSKQSTQILRPKKHLRDHQKEALSAVRLGLSGAERGKLIMACGTGKTFTSLKIAENLAGRGKRVLFLVPSLSLLSQTLSEWTQESEIPLRSYAVCSDSDIGKKRKSDEDVVRTFAHELQFPATTKANSLARAVEKAYDDQHMTVVFSTYHSIATIHEAQFLDENAMGEFDLIICDEAHRTTGATLDGEDESAFVRIHDAHYVLGAKRLYMTATPRIYGDFAKASAEKDKVTLCSMDDEEMFGKQLYVITFSEAVKRELLVDYKVIVLAVDEAHISRKLQTLLSSSDNQLKVDDAAKIVGCWKALAKQGLNQDLHGDEEPMKRAVAFAQVIEISKGAKTHKVSSKQIASMFQAVVEEYQKNMDEEEEINLKCFADHVDGGMNATEKESKLQWLKEETDADTCRILSNVRCLSEGVDVPSLDAVLFLTPRSSQVDVVQSVGRVMRLSQNKKRGYVILPVVIPAGIEAHEALNDNKSYQVVWQVLNALRSHDDRFDAMINKLELTGNDNAKMEVIAITDKANFAKAKKGEGKKDSYHKAKSGRSLGEKIEKSKGDGSEQVALEFNIGEIEKAIYAKVVQKVGNRSYWEEWAKDIAKIAQTHITRIKTILDNNQNGEKAAFDQFANELRDDLNDSVSDDEIVEMLAQHLITKPVFDALFEGYSFASNNPMSVAMQDVLDKLNEHNLDKEADTLQKFYDSVKLRAAGIESAEGKQKIVVELYDKFFRSAFPKMTEKLGIVYTPVEVVDFIIHSVNHLLQKEFGQTLGSKGVHIIDPFTGTGTFITRLLQSGLIAPEELEHKYKHEIHANELVLLAYYIAAINIESVYHSLSGGSYVPFEGICLTDTFQMYEKEDLIAELLANNSKRRKRQKNLDIRVIIGNPPYSAGQTSANDNNANVAYPYLDERIRSTYADKSVATNKNALYDSYIRGIRWASDRVGQSGIIGFVTNAGFVEANTADGLRKCLAEEFSSIYIFHLRGNQRTQGELSRKEGGKIFGSGSRAPIAISFLVKNPDSKEMGQIHFCDIGDYLSREEKLAKIVEFASVAGIDESDLWKTITPDEHGDWLGQRDNSFGNFIVIGDKKSKSQALFENYSNGLKTNADTWMYNSSKSVIHKNLTTFINTYNENVDGYKNSDKSKVFMDFAITDSQKIKWHSGLIPKAIAGKNGYFNNNLVVISAYRPFEKTFGYFDSMFVQRVSQLPSMVKNNGEKNLFITTNSSHSNGIISLITDVMPDLHFNGDTQCFPLYLYDDKQSTVESQDLFAGETKPSEPTKRHAITDEGLNHFKTAYPNENIGKEDIFYYVYGLLHSPDYRERYADNLSKELPRIPCVKGVENFWAFVQAGRELADLHLNYETVKMHPVKMEVSGTTALTDEDYRVTKMKYGKDKDKSILHYNERITLRGIPLEAYDYVVNGKSALDWVVERQCVKTDKDSGIVNDANDWAIETMGNPKYPLELFQRVITVSLETMRVVHDLPELGDLA